MADTNAFLKIDAHVDVDDNDVQMAATVAAVLATVADGEPVDKDDAARAFDWYVRHTKIGGRTLNDIVTASIYTK